MRKVEAQTSIRAAAHQITAAFLMHEHLNGWWYVQRSLVEPKKGGVWALAWEVTEAGIKYVSSGTIGEYDPGKYLRIDNLVYLNTERQILGPMQLEIFVNGLETESKVKIIQSGYLYGGDWDWYYDAVVQGWPHAVQLLKKYLEG
ncbi:MAG: SRPBCC domain-containing protein [Chitinophagaceae bacterium]|nr:SRPBCC domain-containing protein [Chitinophagaceae bacterium]